MNRTGRSALKAIFATACAIGLIYGLGNDNARAGETIVAFGDSITAGYPYMADGNGCTYCLGYEYYLQYYLNWEGKGKTVYNYGILGELLTDAGVNRIDSIMAATRADYVLIMEGTNDLTFWVDPGTVAYNVYLVANKVLQWGGKPVVGTLLPDTRGGADWKNVNTTNSYIRSYINSNPLMCLSDQYSAIAPYWDSGYTYDQLHPNYWGYWLMAWTWYSSMANCGY